MITYAQIKPPPFPDLMSQDTPPTADQANHQLSQDRATIAFDTATEARELAISMIAQGSRQALLFSRALEPLLYNNREFEVGLLQLLRGNPHSHCQVLVQNPEDLFSTDHRLLAVNQNLSSYMQIRLAPDEARDVMENFLLVDDSGYLKRPDSAAHQGIASFHDPSTVRELSYSFRQWWEQSSPLQGARRLHI